jgi:hypothetical protein
MKKNPPLLSTMLINRFEGICGTFGKGGLKNIVINNIGSVCPPQKKQKPIIIIILTNDHGGGC